jgi:asparagine synthase (glutamine-hydrolysing)
MPGIFGIIRKAPYDGIRRDLGLMMKAMHHESSYNTGQYVNEELGLYAGWICHQGSFSDCMPLMARSNDVVLIFHGENQLDPESAAELQRAGYEVDRSNARYLIDLYTELGSEFLQRLNGWYAGVLVDLRRKRVTLFNDRYGMGRIYFHEGNDEFIFASEAKSLLRIRPSLRTIDQEGLADYLRYNCVTKDRTLFKGISLLPHASSFEFEGPTPKRTRYFDFSKWENQPGMARDEFYSAFTETVTTNFPAYAAGVQGVGLSLTAGLDTRLVMAALGRTSSHYSCYTFGGKWGELYDVGTARKLSQVYNKTFAPINISTEFLRNFPTYAAKGVFISDGTHDAFGAHDVFFNQLARDIAPVRLTGKFGSEVVRVRKLVDSLTYPSGLLSPEFSSQVRSLPRFAEQNPAGHPLTRVVTEEIPWHEFGRNYVEQSQLTLRTPYMDNALVKLMYRAPERIRNQTDLQETYVRQKAPELSTLPTNMGRFVSTSRMVTKAMDIWYRALFKVEYIYLFATPHWLTRLDRKLEGARLERILAGRQKWEGYRIWIKTDFADFVRQTLLNPMAHYDSYFQRKTVEKMVDRHTAGTHNYLSEINKALTVELIFSSLLEQ